MQWTRQQSAQCAVAVQQLADHQPQHLCHLQASTSNGRRVVVGVAAPLPAASTPTVMLLRTCDDELAYHAVLPSRHLSAPCLAPQEAHCTGGRRVIIHNARSGGAGDKRTAAKQLQPKRALAALLSQEVWRALFTQNIEACLQSVWQRYSAQSQTPVTACNWYWQASVPR